MASLNNYIKDLSYKYYLKNSALETSSINTSVNTITSNLKMYFGSKLKDVFIFGSFDRDTILPRAYDNKSDVDILVIFNHTDHERTPETYRNWLVQFAEFKYGRSTIYKSHPSVVLELKNIKFDLVPAKYENNWYSNTYYIPDTSNNWMLTDPVDFKKKLTDANTQYNNIVKPIVRLFKAWNGYVGYPFESFVIEQFVARQSYYGDNYQTGFLYAIRQTSQYSGNTTQNQKIQSLKNNADWVKTYLDRENILKAKEALHRILPY